MLTPLASSAHILAGVVVTSAVTPFTTISIIALSVQLLRSVTVYVIVCVPTPADAGSKSPNTGLVIPFPDHVPPTRLACIVSIPPETQNGPAGNILGSGNAKTSTITVASSVQPAASVAVYVIVYIPGPATSTSKTAVPSPLSMSAAPASEE